MTVCMASTNATLKIAGELGSRQMVKMWLFLWLQRNCATKQFVMRSLSVKVGTTACKLHELCKNGEDGENSRLCVGCGTGGKEEWQISGGLGRRGSGKVRWRSEGSGKKRGEGEGERWGTRMMWQAEEEQERNGKGRGRD